MKTNKIFFLLFLIIIIFSVSAFAEYSTFTSDNFDYCSNSFETRSWLFSSTIGNWTEYPKYSSNLGSCAYGSNYTALGASGSYNSVSLRQNPTAQNWLTGIIRISFTLETGNQTLTKTGGEQNNIVQIQLLNDTTQSLMALEFKHNSVNISRTYGTGGNIIHYCNLPLIRPYILDVQWKIDLNAHTTSLLIINTSSGEEIILCENIDFVNMTYQGIIAPITLFKIASNPETGRINELFLDDFVVEVSNFSTGISTNLPAYSYCDVNTNCLTGYCLNNKCQYKTDDMICSSSSECLSGSCINTHCTNPDLVVKINSFWGDLGIVSLGSKLLIGLIIIIAVILIVAFSTANMIAISVSALASLFVVVYLGLFPIWIVILIIIMGAVGFFAFFSGGK